MLLNKRGLSPIVATMLLISIAMVLAIIVLLWVRSFVSEQVQKDLGGGPEPIEVACERIDFDADATLSGSDLVITVVNHGNIPLHQLDLKKKGLGSVKSLTTEPIDFDIPSSVLSGQTRDATMTPSPVAAGETIVVTPVVLGSVDDSTKAFPCEVKSLDVEVRDA